MKIKNILPVIILIFILTSCAEDGGGGCGDNPANSSGVVRTDFSQLNDTGITLGGDYPSGNNSDCTGAEIGQQDCSHGRDALAAKNKLTKTGGGVAGFDFTKLGKTGTALTVQNANWSDTGSEATGTKWSCVKDNHTGLVWEVKTNSTGIHYKDNTYKWGGLTALGKEHPDNIGTYYDDWNSLVNGTNSEQLCGFDDWRVPTMVELRSIAYYGKINPAIDTHYFPNTPGSGYWSSWPSATSKDSVWLLYFDYGDDGSNVRGSLNRVRLVRFVP